ncbi:hypothetical protein AMELA_G00070910 [Ameiurus melas]|uniref:Uncharacterized protein n=1 Tax=Ameiurus melas TaxID=219545 RepID=A0A7J6AZB6_AMEME|nr:hypothetical protein AMELA_G00070910 [Ameiurus melas]
MTHTHTLTPLSLSNVRVMSHTGSDLCSTLKKFTSCVTETLQKDIQGSEGQRTKLNDHNLTVLRADQAKMERERMLKTRSVYELQLGKWYSPTT